MEVEEYLKNYRQRIKKEEVERKELFKKLNKKTRQAVEKVGDEYKIEKIYLFGSLVDEEKFRLNSDIDLAVEGLKVADYLDFWGELEKELEYSFDLVQVEKADDPLLETIKEEGEIIYESGR